MTEKVPLVKVDVDAGVKSKFSDLVTDASISVLCVLLVGQAMEKKHNALEAKHKDASEDVKKWKQKTTNLEARLKEALKDKIEAAEKATGDMKVEKEVVELERDSWKGKPVGLEGELVEAKSVVEESRGLLAEYFDNGFVSI